jgi:hypothetical protein
MKVAPDVWYLRVIREPGNARAEWGHHNAFLGTSIWGTVPWMAPTDPITELEVLQELYGALVDLMEHRSSLG